MAVSDEDSSASRNKNNKKTASVNKANKNDKKKSTKESAKEQSQTKKTETKGTSKNGGSPVEKKNNKGESRQTTNELDRLFCILDEFLLISFFQSNISFLYCWMMFIFSFIRYQGGKNKGNENKNQPVKGSESRNVNEVESTDGGEESGHNLLPVDFSTLDSSCLAEGDSNNPLVPSPAVPYGAGIKYIRSVGQQQIFSILYFVNNFILRHPPPDFPLLRLIIREADRIVTFHICEVDMRPLAPRSNRNSLDFPLLPSVGSYADDEETQFRFLFSSSFISLFRSLGQPSKMMSVRYTSYWSFIS